jgi:predicted DNA-binding transcriptional regulator AlpA
MTDDALGRNAPQTGCVPKLLTVREVAVRLRISERSVWRLLSKQAIVPPLRIGGVLRWRESDIIRWLDQNCPPHVEIDPNPAEKQMIENQKIGTIQRTEYEGRDA